MSHPLPEYAEYIALGDEDHFGLPWKVDIHRPALERTEGLLKMAPQSVAECCSLVGTTLGKAEANCTAGQLSP